MNNKLPYEQKIEDQLVDIPLPDENAAWEDMRKRLEDDDDDGIIPFWLRGCGLWGLVGIIILAVSWWLIRPEKWWNKKQQTESVKNILKENHSEHRNTKLPDSAYALNKKTETNNNDIVDGNNETGAETTSSGKFNIEEQNISKKKKENGSLRVTNGDETKKQTTKIISVNQQSVKKVVKKNKPGSDQKNGVSKNGQSVITSQNETKNDIIDNKPEGINTSQGDVIKDSVPMKINELPVIDSAKTIIADSLNKKQEEEQAKKKQQKKDSTKSEKIFFSAGIGLQQQIPIDGQKLVPYSSLGRKNILSDYIPSVYFQANKPNKWFANIGFRYGAPQYNKEFTYNQEIVFDSSTQTDIVTSLNLKKSFYHQLPVTFNYFIRPKWSVGAGAVWNKFYGAVADQEISKRSGGQADTLLSKETVSFTSDSTSSFSKSYFQALIETEYNWKRFYFGARYSFGLQPYIKFTLPGGTQQKERNSSLQVFIRYDLWRSKKK